jgi:hypothetical protein
MALPRRFFQLAATSAFWSDYFGDEVFGEKIVGLPSDSFLSFPLGPRHRLRVGYWLCWGGQDRFIQATELRLQNRRTTADWRLGWRADDGHVHPHVLRWEEADLIGRAIAMMVPQLKHPGIPLLLLAPYVASIEGTDCALGVWLVDRALRSLGILSDKQIRYRVSSFSRHHADDQWRKVAPYGWVCHSVGNRSWPGVPIKSLRRSPKPGANQPPPFPFDEWNEAVHCTEQQVAPRTRRQPSPRRKISLPLSRRSEWRIQFLDSDQEGVTAPQLRRELHYQGVGVCYLVGGWCAAEDFRSYCAHGDIPNRGNEYMVIADAPPAFTVKVVRRVLKKAANPDVILYRRLGPESRQPYRRIPLDVPKQKGSALTSG